MSEITKIDRGKFHEDLVNFGNKAFQQNYLYPKRHC